MADKKQISLNPCTTNSSSRGGASGLPMDGGEVFSPKPSTTKSLGFSLHPCCTQVEGESAPKRKARRAGPKGCATKRKGDSGLAKREDAADEEATAEKAAVTVADDETMEQEAALKIDKVHEECKARFEALMEKLFGGGPGSTPVRIVEYVPCMSTYPGEEELGVVDDGNLPPVTN